VDPYPLVAHLFIGLSTLWTPTPHLLLDIAALFMPVGQADPWVKGSSQFQNFLAFRGAGVCGGGKGWGWGRSCLWCS